MRCESTNISFGCCRTPRGSHHCLVKNHGGYWEKNTGVAKEISEISLAKWGWDLKILLFADKGAATIDFVCTQKYNVC